MTKYTFRLLYTDGVSLVRIVKAETFVEAVIVLMLRMREDAIDLDVESLTLVEKEVV